jgi:hypothetical protein
MMINQLSNTYIKYKLTSIAYPLQAATRQPKTTPGLPIRRQYAYVVSRTQSQWNMCWLSARKYMPSSLSSAKFPQYNRPDTHSILYIVRNRRGQLNIKACSLAIACGLRVIHRTRLRCYFPKHIHYQH